MPMQMDRRTLAHSITATAISDRHESLHRYVQWCVILSVRARLSDRPLALASVRGGADGQTGARIVHATLPSPQAVDNGERAPGVKSP